MRRMRNWACFGLAQRTRKVVHRVVVLVAPRLFRLLLTPSCVVPPGGPRLFVPFLPLSGCVPPQAPGHVVFLPFELLPDEQSLATAHVPSMLRAPPSAVALTYSSDVSMIDFVKSIIGSRNF